MYQELLLTIAYRSEEDTVSIPWMWRYYEELDEIMEENRIIAMYRGFIIIFFPRIPKGHGYKIRSLILELKDRSKLRKIFSPSKHVLVLKRMVDGLKWRKICLRRRELKYQKLPWLSHLVVSESGLQLPGRMEKY